MSFAIRPGAFFTAFDKANLPAEFVVIEPEDYILIMNHCLPGERARMWSMMCSSKRYYSGVGTSLYCALDDLRRGVYDCLSAIDDGTDAPVAIDVPGNVQSVVDITSSKDSSCYTISDSLTDSQSEE